MLELTNRQIKILKYIRKHHDLSQVLRHFKYSDEEDAYIAFQCDFPNCANGLINFSFDESVTTVSLTSDAIFAIESWNRNRLRMWIPIVISALALIVSIISLHK